MSRRIFRRKALERYNARLDKIELPRYAAPPWVLLLWSCCGLLLLFTLLLWRVRLPVYTAGPGVVIAAPAELPAGLAVATFVPANAAQGLQTGQPALIDLSEALGQSTAGAMTGQVALISSETLAPAVARTRYGLDASTGLLIQGPVLVVLIPLERARADLIGSVAQVQIEVGAQRGLALLPGWGQWGMVGEGEEGRQGNR
jgi:hypothetical protein